MGEFYLLAKSIYERKADRIKTVVKYLLYLPQMPYIMNNHSEPIIKSTVCPLNCYSSCSFKVEARETDMGFGAAFHDNKVEIAIVI